MVMMMMGYSHRHGHGHSQGWGSAPWFVLVVALVGCVGASATVHMVGDLKGWSLPERVSVNYTEWSANTTCRLGDSLLFVYNSTYHNVEEVSAADYNNCSSTNGMATYTDGNTTIPLNKTGMHYFICSIPTHCTLGQKVAVNVLAADASAPSPSSSSSSTSNTSSTSAPSPSGASSSKPPSVISLLGVLGGSLIGTISLMLLAY